MTLRSIFECFVRRTKLCDLGRAENRIFLSFDVRGVIEKCVVCLLVYSFTGVFIFPFFDEMRVMG